MLIYQASYVKHVKQINQSGIFCLTVCQLLSSTISIHSLVCCITLGLLTARVNQTRTFPSPVFTTFTLAEIFSDVTVCHAVTRVATCPRKSLK